MFVCRLPQNQTVHFCFVWFVDHSRAKEPSEYHKKINRNYPLTFTIPLHYFQTHPLSSMERWVCSRLYSTVLQCELGFEAYELHTVTSALQSFWVNSLCDVYLVRIHRRPRSWNGQQRAKGSLKKRFKTAH